MRIRHVNFLLVISVILVSGSLYYASLLQNYFLGILFLFLVPYFLSRRQSVNRNKSLLVLLTTVLAVSNLESKPSSVLVLLTCLICALIITETISFDDFSRAYIKITQFLCVASWFFLPVILFQIPSPLPDFISIVDQPYANFAFFGVSRPEMPAGYNEMYYVTRNSGLFWEPGAFQIFVNTAFYLAIIRNELSKKMLFTFLATILTIGSTSGLLVFGLLWAANYLRTTQYRSVLSSGVTIVLAIVALSAVVALNSIHGSLDKFKEGSSSNDSFIARSTDYIIDSKIFVDHLWRGAGYGNVAVREQYGIAAMGADRYWSAAKPTGADGLLIFLSFVGSLGVIVVWRLIYPSQISDWRLREKGLIFMALVMMYNSENMFMYLFPWIMMFYGFSVHSKSGRSIAASAGQRQKQPSLESAQHV